MENIDRILPEATELEWNAYLAGRNDAKKGIHAFPNQGSQLEKIRFQGYLEKLADMKKESDLLIKYDIIIGEDGSVPDKISEYFIRNSLEDKMREIKSINSIPDIPENELFYIIKESPIESPEDKTRRLLEIMHWIEI